MTTDLITKERPVISKGEHCLSCLLKSEVVEYEEGVAIICSKELKGDGVVELDPSDSCPCWQLDPDADIIVPETEYDKDVEASQSEPELPGELLQAYEFVGDSLVLVKDVSTKTELLHLTTSFVEAYNAMVQLTKFQVERKILELNSNLGLLLEETKQIIRECPGTPFRELSDVFDKFNREELNIPADEYDDVFDPADSDVDAEEDIDSFMSSFELEAGDVEDDDFEELDFDDDLDDDAD